MTAKFTKPPWEASHQKGAYGQDDTYEIHWSADGECVAEVVHGHDNAHLIAAAPELYAIGAKILAKLDHPTDPVTAIDADELRAALAKANGEQR